MKVTFDDPESGKPADATGDGDTAPTEDDAREDGAAGAKESPTDSQWCPVCEIKVPLGYLTCPKCKGRLPGARMPRPTSGTTTMIAGARRPIWLLLVLAMAGAGAIYYHFVADSESEGGVHRRGRVARAAPAEPRGDGGVPEMERLDEDAGPPATEADREQALSEIVDALEAAGFEATAEPLAADASVLVLRSEACGAETLHEILRGAEPDLSEGGFHSARCFSTSGLLSYKSTW